jgi:uncharacterized protein YbjT (DUF2867 family)
MTTGKILITGATGDTGGYAIEQLLENGRPSGPSSTAATTAPGAWKTRAWRWSPATSST